VDDGMHGVHANSGKASAIRLSNGQQNVDPIKV